MQSGIVISEFDYRLKVLLILDLLSQLRKNLGSCMLYNFDAYKNLGSCMLYNFVAYKNLGSCMLYDFDTFKAPLCLFT